MALHRNMVIASPVTTKINPNLVNMALDGPRPVGPFFCTNPSTILLAQIKKIDVQDTCGSKIHEADSNFVK